MPRIRDLGSLPGRHRPPAPARRGPTRRVLHVAPFLWSGAGKAITALLSDQCGRFDVSLVTSPASGALRNWPEYDRALQRARVQHRRIDLFHRDAATFWGAVDALARHLHETRPHLLHAHAGVPTAVALLARDRLDRRIPVVSHVYSWGPGRPAWMNSMDLWAHRQADVVVCSARSYERLLLNGGVARARLRLVPWGVAVVAGEGEGKRRRAGLEARAADACGLTRLADTAPGESARSTFVVGTVGRIEPRKNQLALVEAFARLATKHPGARLELVGPAADAAYAATIAERVRLLGIGSRVTVHGHVDDVARVVGGWSLYVSLSSDEGQGLAVLEAMAMGLPVAAASVPGVEDYLRDGLTGFVLPGGSAARVATNLARLMRDSGGLARVARNGARMVQRRFRWAHTVDAIDAIYAEVMASSPEPREPANRRERRIESAVARPAHGRKHRRAVN